MFSKFNVYRIEKRKMIVICRWFDTLEEAIDFAADKVGKIVITFENAFGDEKIVKSLKSY